MNEFESAKNLFLEGLEFLEGQKLREAESRFRQALALMPDRVSILTNLSAVLIRLGKMSEARELARRSVALDKTNEQGWLNLGICLESDGSFLEALDCHETALAIKPDSAEAWSNRGNALRELRRYDEALASYEKALSLKPDYAEAWANRGNTLRDLKRYDDALASYDKALLIRPDYAEAWSHRGLTLGDLRRHAEALAHHDKAVALRPDYAEAWSNRGLALGALKRRDEELACYEKALAIKPDFAEAWSNLGGLLLAKKDFKKALASCDKALGIKPDFSEAWHIRGLLNHELKQYNDALACYQKAAGTQREIPYLMGHWLSTKMLLCDWDGLDEIREQVIMGVEQGERVCEPFPFLAVSGSAALQKKCAETFVADNYAHLSAPPVARERNQLSGKLRIGYFSSDFRSHPVSFLAAGLFESHDRSKFEVIGFNLHEPTGDLVERRVSASFDAFLNLSSVDYAQAIQLIREKNLDIAIDLNGHTAGQRTEFFAQRMAPVQVNYLGYSGTMGAKFIDYIVGDDVLIPEELRHNYVEKIAYMPNSFMVNDSKKEISNRVFTRSEMGLPEDAFVFCCFNNGYKIAPDVFGIWMNLLEKVPGSVLWLSSQDKIAVENLKKECQKKGIVSDRLVFAERMDQMSEHLARQRLADLFLDTFYYNAHTTASDALWAGLPVLTCMGGAFASRVAGSLLNAVGLPQLITRSHSEYERLAYELATSSTQLKEIRARLAENRLTYPLFDTALFTRHIEDAYTRMWERHERGLAPDHIYV
jgi:protein O-GlcNAc transferase